MLSFSGGRIFIAAGPTDMRKSFNSLAGIVSERLGMDPMSRDIFLFCNRRKNRLKVLVYDESGVWVLAKRLDRGTFAWPEARTGRTSVEYGEEQLTLLLRGFDAQALEARPWRRRKHASSAQCSPVNA